MRPFDCSSRFLVPPVVACCSINGSGIAIRIAVVVSRATETNLRLAAQVGVTDIVGRYPGPRLQEMTRLVRRVDGTA